MDSASQHPDPGSGKSAREIERLIEEHLGLVDALARKILRGLPSHVDVDDLVSFGRIGLVQSAQRFDPARGVLFKTFAYYRIRGAIYDGIRKMAWFAEAPAGRVTFEAAAGEILGEEAERAGADAGGPGLEQMIGEAREMAATLVTARMLSLDATPISVPDTSKGPAEIREAGQLASLIRSCVHKLDEKEQSVVTDYYFHHLTLEEAGAKLGLSKSWTCRVHARALKRLQQLALELGLGDPA